MHLIKFYIKKYFAHFTYFYINLRHRIFIALSLSILVGLLDGFGLAMFLPLLEMVDGKAEASSEAMGNLGFIIDFLKELGLNINLKAVLLVMLLFFSLKGLVKFFESYYKLKIQQYFIKKLRLDMVHLLSHFQYKAFAMADVGRIQNTLSGETGRVVQAFSNYMMTLQNAVMLVVYMFLAFLANAQFAILVCFGGLASNFLFQIIYSKTKGISKSITSEGHNFQGLLIQKVAHFKYLKATSLYEKYAEKLAQTIQKIEGDNLKMGYYSALITAIREPITIGIVVLVILVQVSYFSQGLGLIILSLLFFYRALTFLVAMQTSWNGFLNVSGSLENMKDFQKGLEGQQDNFGKLEFKGINDAISIENVSFGFTDDLILKNLNFKIEKNKTYAFVGESGSGKTTLVNLISGLLKPTQGNIFIDNYSMEELDARTFQKNIGYITQEPVIFNDNIFNNVTFWSEKNKKNLEKFWIALERASIAEFIQSLPKQENELLGNNGINLSGGQKQRISIAREFFKDIDLLILDEATSSLDSETEQIIQHNIESFRGQQTILIIAHRLSTIINADVVVLLNQGKIESVSTYTDLLESSEKFKNMVKLQKI